MKQFIHFRITHHASRITHHALAKTASILLTFLLIGFFSTSLQAQSTDLLTEITKPQNLTNGKETYLNRMVNDVKTKGTLRYISPDDIVNHLDANDKLTLNLPGHTSPLQVAQTYFDAQANGNYTWAGELENVNGYAAFMEYEGHFAGFIQTDDHFWKISPLIEGVGVLRELEIAAYQDEVCSLLNIDVNEPPVEMGVVDLCDEQGGCGGIVDVLLLIPPDVPPWYGASFGTVGEAFTDIALSLFAFQFAAMNSGIDDLRLRFHSELFDFDYSNPLDWVDDLFTTLPNDGSDIREDYKADIVVLLTAMDYPPIFGAAYAPDPEDDWNWAAPCFDCGYLIAEVGATSDPRWTLAHEVAHLFGARHNRSENVPCIGCNGSDNTDICTHGWRFDNGGQDRTILALMNAPIPPAPPINERALQFSNPDVMFNGFDTGTEDDNNSLALRNGACEIINYFDDPLLGVTVTVGNTVVCVEDGDFQAFANVHEAAPALLGHPPYMYSWNATNASTSSTGSTASFSFSCFSGCTINVNLTVTSADGQVVHATKQVQVVSEPCKWSGLQEDNLNAIKVYPNPTTDVIRVQFAEEMEHHATLSILDINGKIILTQEVKAQKVVEMDMTPFPSGIYLLQIRDNNKTMVEKIVKH